MADVVTGPLWEMHASEGVCCGEYHGAWVPLRFTNAQREHLAVRHAVGFLDFSFRARIAARGEDHVSFLHNILSNDIKRLRPAQGTYATLLNVKGQILVDLRVYRETDRILLETDADLREKAWQALERYIVMDDVTLERLDAWGLSVQGPRSRELLVAAGLELPPLEEFDHFHATWSGGPLHITRGSSTGEEGYDLWGSAETTRAAWQALQRAAATFEALPCGTEALESLRIEAGIPRYGSELGEDTIPLEAGLLNALSFSKGCYPGQEIVERARSRGHVNWKLVGLTLVGVHVPAPGSKIRADGKEVGEVTSACFSPTLQKPLALAYLRREFSEPGTPVTVDCAGAAQVSVLPFYQRAR
jgi:glycine cleavage system T protein